ncbi:MAG: DegT/DnrJ/EryC1/StrS family aminotransferase [Planctomycetota bacterium]|nr:DegT/DnrJ/EryC1/StrS family aminotransferase [Planctomycetota bacterium]
MTKLAIHGGPKAKPTPYSPGKYYGEEELQHIREVLDTGTLSWRGGKVDEFEKAAAERFQVKHVVTVSSGTAAMHTALAALGAAEGDEVITTPLTDMGTVEGILAQHSIPVFADSNLHTRSICPESVRSLITDRTKVVLLVHHGGLPCDMDAFLKLGEETGVKILEDVAQAHGGRHRGREFGSMGHANGFSMNESKHMTVGEGGFVTTNDDETARIASMFRDKAYIRDEPVAGGRQPVPFAALNYRPTAIDGAIALAQLGRLDYLVSRRREIAAMYFEGLPGLPGLDLPTIVEGGEPAYWPLTARYTADDPSRDVILDALKAEGLSIFTGMSPPGNILDTELIQKRKFYPLTDAIPHFWRDTEYDAESCPNVNELLRTVLRLPVSHYYTDEDIEQTIAGVRKVWDHYFQI